MDITIVIVNWNGGDMLLRCLQTIRESRQSFKVKVIVVDNDSGDGSRQAAAEAYPEFTVINSGANLGFGRANNLAKTMVDTPLVLFLNPDTELETDSLECAVRCLNENPKVAVVGCKMLYPSGEVQEQGLQWFPTPWTIFLEFLLDTRLTRHWLPTMDPNRSGEVRKLYGGFLLGRKEVIDEAGWFDDRYFMYVEDVDLCRTVAALGWKLYYCAESRIMHVAGGTSAKAPSGFSILMKARSLDQYMRKYYGWPGAFFFRLVVFSGSTIRLLALLILRLIPGAVKASRRPQWSASVFKQKLSIQWVFGFKKAAVPGPAASRLSRPSSQPLEEVS
jgi:N-acetylglucosaminyl-diphospho-decaprenol L-rhamnosyltransferase